MKAIFSLIFISLIHVAVAQGTIVLSSICDTGDMGRLREEAVALTIADARQNGAPIGDSVLVPYMAYEQIAKELSAIYRIRDTQPVIDTIFRYLSDNTPAQAHGGIAPSVQNGLHALQVSADTNVLWVSNIVHGIFPTGNDTADDLIRHYGLTVHPQGNCCLNMASVVQFHISTDTVINPFALGKCFNALSGVQGYDAFLPNETNGDWSCTTRIDSGTFALYRFKYAFGDCNPSCFGHHYWLCRVYPDCSVRLDTSWGDGINVNTAVSALDRDPITLSPNPSSDRLYVSGSRDDMKVTIMDITGRTYETSQKADQVDISDLAPGVYTILIPTTRGAEKKRFVKE